MLNLRTVLLITLAAGFITGGAAGVFAREPESPLRTPPVSGSTLRTDSSSVLLREVPASALEKFRGDNAFSYDRIKPPSKTWWDDLYDWFWENVRRLFWSRTFGTAWRFFGYALIAALVIFIVLRLTGTSFGSLLYGIRNPEPMKFKEESDNIHAMDFDKLIAEAALRKEYRRAVRLHYLQTLRELSARNFIEWREAKTNRDYLYELKDEPLRRALTEATLLYEYAWYGDFAIDTETFEKVRAVFVRLNKQVAATAAVAA